MLLISDKQMDVFHEALRNSLEERLFQHASATYRDLFRLFGAPRMRVLVRRAIHLASRYEFVSETANRMFLRLVLECGSGFDSDPVFAYLGPLLQARYAERKRLTELAAAADQYSEKTAPGLRAAASRFQKFPTVWPARMKQDLYLRQLRSCCAEIFPEKAAIIPETAWPALDERVSRAAAERGWGSAVAHAVLYALFFVAGTGLICDPRFDFIRTLPADPAQDPGLVLHRMAANEFQRWFTHTK